MPVGCQWTFAYRNGARLTHTYVGRINGLYDVRTTVSGHPQRLVNNMWFDRAGDMVERLWNNGRWERFSPASCATRAGSCRAVYTNSAGARQEIESTTQRAGNHYDQYWHLRGKRRLHHVSYSEGRFGVVVRATQNGVTITGGDFRHCGR